MVYAKILITEKQLLKIFLTLSAISIAIAHVPWLYLGILATFNLIGGIFVVLIELCAIIAGCALIWEKIKQKSWLYVFCTGVIVALVFINLRLSILFLIPTEFYF